MNGAIIAGISASILLLFFTIIILLRRRRKVKDKSSVVPQNVQPAIGVNYIPSPGPSSAAGNLPLDPPGERYLVPLELLPPSFDFNDPRVIHKGDHVTITDLSLIEHKMEQKEEYQKPSPYNPNFQ